MAGFSELLVQRLRSQAELLKSLTQHTTLIGSGREGAFKDLVRELLPRRLEVLEGTVAGPVGPDGPTRTKRQVDCMLVDTFTYPTLLRSGNLAVVLHHAVRAIVEVKGEVFAVKTSEEEAFRQMLIQVGKTRDTLGPASTVLTALLIFDAKVTAAKLRSWLEAAISYRNAVDPGTGLNDERAALSTIWLPQYIVTSGGVLVEKLGTQYSVYEMGADEAIVYLLAVLLRVSLLPPDEASSFGVLPPIGNGKPAPVGGAASPPAADETSSSSAETNRLSEAYTEFTTHFALVPSVPIGTIDLAGSLTPPTQEP